VETFAGSGGLGPIYADAVTVLCKASAIRQLVRDDAGVEVISELTLYVHPSDAASFLSQSRLAFAGNTSTVLSAAPQARPGETVLVKVTCL
jgi:hypothetical protein